MNTGIEIKDELHSLLICELQVKKNISVYSKVKFRSGYFLFKIRRAILENTACRRTKTGAAGTISA